MRVVLGFLVVLLVSVPAGATSSADHDRTLIIPGQRLGAAQLGMNRLMIDMTNRASLCPVVATYDGSGGATWLETNWGGGCLLSDDIQVGLPFGPASRKFGDPDLIVKDARYPHATAVWIAYLGRGIAFRVLGWHAGAIIQAIAVFRTESVRIPSGSGLDLSDSGNATRVKGR